MSEWSSVARVAPPLHTTKIGSKALAVAYILWQSGGSIPLSSRIASFLDGCDACMKQFTTNPWTPKHLNGHKPCVKTSQHGAESRWWFSAQYLMAGTSVLLMADFFRKRERLKVASRQEHAQQPLTEEPACRWHCAHRVIGPRVNALKEDLACALSMLGCLPTGPYPLCWSISQRHMVPTR